MRVCTPVEDPERPRSRAIFTSGAMTCPVSRAAARSGSASPASSKPTCTAKNWRSAPQSSGFHSSIERRREAPTATMSTTVRRSDESTEFGFVLRQASLGCRIQMSIEDAPLSAVSNAIRFSAHSTLPWSARSGTSFFRQLPMKQTPKFSSPTARDFSLRFVAASPRIEAAWASASVGQARRASRDHGPLNRAAQMTYNSLRCLALLWAL